MRNLTKEGKRGNMSPISKQRGVGVIKVLLFIPLVLVIVIALAIAFYEGRKAYYDAQIDEMCAKDGGIKVYEAVTLPADRFDKYGNIGVNIKRYAKPTDEYYYELDEVVLRKGEPTLFKYTSKIIRRSDNKTLGMEISYGRGGGSLPGPWHPSTYNCPQKNRAIKTLKHQSF